MEVAKLEPQFMVTQSHTLFSFIDHNKTGVQEKLQIPTGRKRTIFKYMDGFRRQMKSLTFFKIIMHAPPTTLRLLTLIIHIPRQLR